MKKIICCLGLYFLVFLFSGYVYGQCEEMWWNESGVCLEKWCVNAGGNVGISCQCGTAVKIDCPGGDQ